MRQPLDPRIAAFLTPQFRAPRMFGEQGQVDTGQGTLEALADLMARGPGATAPQAPQGPAAQPGSPYPSAPEPAARASMEGQPRPGPRNWFRVLSRAAASGEGIAAAMDYEDERGRAGQAREAAARRQAEMEALADSLEMGDEERLLFMTDPETWAKVAQSRHEVRTAAQGSIVGDGSGPLWGAPEIGMDGGVPYSLDPMGGEATYGTARPLGPNEQAMAEHRARQAATAEAKAAEAARHNRAQEGTAASREARQGSRQGARSNRRPGAPASPARAPWSY